LQSRSSGCPALLSSFSKSGLIVLIVLSIHFIELPLSIRRSRNPCFKTNFKKSPAICHPLRATINHCRSRYPPTWNETSSPSDLDRNGQRGTNLRTKWDRFSDWLATSTDWKRSLGKIFHPQPRIHPPCPKTSIPSMLVIPSTPRSCQILFRW